MLGLVSAVLCSFCMLHLHIHLLKWPLQCPFGDLTKTRSIGIKKPRYSADEGPSLTELSGYNSKRQEFDPEYDTDVEQALAEMEFKETDSETDRELKLRVLRIYLSRRVSLF